MGNKTKILECLSNCAATHKLTIFCIKMVTQDEDHREIGVLDKNQFGFFLVFPPDGLAYFNQSMWQLCAYHSNCLQDATRL